LSKWKAMPQLIVYIIVASIFASIYSKIAEAKGRDTIKFSTIGFCLSFFFTPFTAVIGIIIISLLPSLKEDRRSLASANNNPGSVYFTDRYVRGLEFVRRARLLEGEILQLLNSLKEEYSKTLQIKERLKPDIQSVFSNLVNLYIPTLDREIITKINPLTGYSKFDFENPLDSLEQDRRNLEDQLTTIENSELYQRRNEIETGGRLQLQLAEYNEIIYPLLQAVNPYETDKNFMTLYRSNYGTSRYTYAGKWWTITYYQHWFWANSIPKKFNKPSFREVAEQYRNLRGSLDEIISIAEPTKKQVKAIEDKIKERERVIQKINTLEEIYISRCRQSLRDHLQYIDRSELYRRAQSEPEISNLIKRLHGLQKKAEYIDEIAQKGFKPQISQLEEKLHKLGKKINKYSRTKNHYVNIPSSDANTWIKNPAQRIRESLERYIQTRELISNFGNYELYDYNQNVSWWRVMTDNRVKLGFISDLDSLPESTITDDIIRKTPKKRLESSRSVYEGDIS